MYFNLLQQYAAKDFQLVIRRPWEVGTTTEDGSLAIETVSHRDTAYSGHK
jgi:hypothetical protein